MGSEERDAAEVEVALEKEAVELEEEVAPEEQIQVTAPVFPWEIVLNSSQTFFQRLPGGGMQIKFAPAVRTPNGAMPMPPGIVVEFGNVGWERFKEEVAADGEKRPTIGTAITVPGRTL
jgi:hypothetical protein